LLGALAIHLLEQFGQSLPDRGGCVDAGDRAPRRVDVTQPAIRPRAEGAYGKEIGQHARGPPARSFVPRVGSVTHPGSLYVVPGRQVAGDGSRGQAPRAIIPACQHLDPSVSPRTSPNDPSTTRSSRGRERCGSVTSENEQGGSRTCCGTPARARAT